MVNKKPLILNNGKTSELSSGDDLDFRNIEAGWSEVSLGATVHTRENRISITTKFEKQGGFIKHSGFIKGNG